MLHIAKAQEDGRMKKTERQDKILLWLADNPMRFTDLDEKMGVSTATLTSDLKKLMKEGKIEKKYDESKDGIVYRLKDEQRYKMLYLDSYARIIGIQIIQDHEEGKELNTKWIKEQLDSYRNKTGELSEKIKIKAIEQYRGEIFW